MTKILRLRLRMTANGLRMTAGKRFSAARGARPSAQGVRSLFSGRGVRRAESGCRRSWSQKMERLDDFAEKGLLKFEHLR
jgi:hypothetical protein